MTSKGRRAVFDKTQGHCHFCGDKVVLGNYGKTKRGYHRGAWELDHIIQAAKGGASNPDNYLPACWKCNRLRWHRTGKDLRELICLGLIAKDEMNRGTEFGRIAVGLKARRKEQNKARVKCAD